MKLLSSLIATCIALTYGQNETDTTSFPDMVFSTTQYFTSTEKSTTTTVIFEELIPSGTDPTDGMADCVFSYDTTLTTEDIFIQICGYTMTEGDEDVLYVAIELTLPAARWVAFGIKAGSKSDPGSGVGPLGNYNGYNIIIPINSKSIKEIFIIGDYEQSSPLVTELESTIRVYSDIKTTALKRKIRLTRKAKITYDDLTNTEDNLMNWNDGYYYDFITGLNVCDTPNTVSVQNGPKDGETYNQNLLTQDEYSNREAVNAEPDEADGQDCVDPELDAASHIMVFGAIIIGFIAFYFV